GRGHDDLDLPGLELRTQLDELLLVEVVLERERLQGGLLDRRVLLRLLQERGYCGFKQSAQVLLTSFTSSSVSGEPPGRRSPPTITTASGAVVFRAGPKIFAEPVTLSSTTPVDLPLPRTALRWGLVLLALRARRKRQPNGRDRSDQEPQIGHVRSLRA